MIASDTIEYRACKHGCIGDDPTGEPDELENKNKNKNKEVKFKKRDEQFAPNKPFISITIDY